MIRSYLKIAYRTLKRQKGYAFINVFGLALGIACCVLLFLYVQHEWTHDRFHEQAERIFRVNKARIDPGGGVSWSASQPALLASELEATFPEVQETVRLADGSVRVAANGAEIEEDALYADAAFFEVFTFPLLRGDPQTALAEPNTVVLTRRAARKHFGGENPMGRTLTVKIEDETVDLRVTGVAQNPPTNSSIQFDVVLSTDTYYEYNFSGILQRAALTRWDFPSAGTFVLLNRTGQAEALEAKLPAFAAQHLDEPPESASGENGEEVRVVGAETTQLRLQSLADIHLNPDVAPAALEPPGNPLYAYLLAGVALLVLGIACINFTTLSLGRSASRAKEVGVRKVVGAHRGQNRRQFWGEAILTSGAALVLGLALARLFLPVFNGLAGRELQLALFSRPETLLFLIALALVVGLLAGSYPALVLSRFEPARVLRGQGAIGGGRRLTRALVVVQFTLSIALVVGVLVMSAQLKFLQSDLGFNQEQVVVIEGLGDTDSGNQIYEPFRQEVLRHAAVEHVAGALFSFFGSAMEQPLALGDTAQVTARVLPVSETFLETLEVGVVQGRGFSAERSTDGYDVLVNETFVRTMGWPSAVGKRFSLPEGAFLSNIVGEMRVIGVVEDFHAQPLHHEIAPLILIPSANFGGVLTMYARIAPEGMAQTLAFLEETWQQVAPDRPFQYQFLDEVVAEAYEAEQQWRAIIRYAAGFALVIACFGLFGLAALAAERRTKEIGIRKVLGASATSITLLLSKDFLKLVLIAFVIAAPVAYWAASRWLQEFAYRIELGPGLFLLAGGAVCVVALGAVSYQAVKTALANPVDALRSE